MVSDHYLQLILKHFQRYDFEELLQDYLVPLNFCYLCLIFSAILSSNYQILHFDNFFYHLFHGPLKIGIGGPVGAGKTSLTEALCRYLSPKLSMAVISNDIYTIEDAEYLMKVQALPIERIKGVETGGCPHTAIREDASINLLAVEEMKEKFPDLSLLLIELSLIHI